MQTLQTVWNFFQNEVLGMKWLNRLIGDIVEACGLDPESRIGGSVQFFFYDVIKIMVLLGVLILMISYIQSFFPPERTKKILCRFHGIGANIIAALLGTVTPFCSCSSIPLFIGFTSAGLPLGVTFSFLMRCWCRISPWGMISPWRSGSAWATRCCCATPCSKPVASQKACSERIDLLQSLNNSDRIIVE